MPPRPFAEIVPMTGMNTATSADTLPVSPGERFVLLDALRGLALFGIALANFPEFSLYSFLPESAAAAMLTATLDHILRFLQYVFIDGKFYTIFSVLFGIGFALLLGNAARKGTNGLALFYRRMSVLFTAGLLHLLFLWSGDILALYAMLGMTLVFFRRVSDKALLILAAALLLVPVGIDAVREATGFHPSAPAVRMQQYYCARYGITDENFAYWLRDARGYPEVFHFLVQGAFVRAQEFIDGNRIFKVMGLFLLGFSVGRNRLYADPGKHKFLLKQTARYGFALGLPFSVAYAYSATHGRPWGLAAHAALYAAGVFPLGLAYMAAFCLWHMRHPRNPVFHVLAAPGRMALTNYLGQSVCGMAIFYGLGLGWGASLGLTGTLAIASTVFFAEAALSRLWLQCFRFGPAEWLWRMLTYKKALPLLKEHP